MLQSQRRTVITPERSSKVVSRFHFVNMSREKHGTSNRFDLSYDMQKGVHLSPKNSLLQKPSEFRELPDLKQQDSSSPLLGQISP